MVSEEPTEGRCNSHAGEDNWGYCESYPVTADDGEPVNGRCRMHGGKGSGAPKGNQNAVGNEGGGAPEDNQNAIKTGLQSDPVNLYEWLKENDRQAARWIMAKLMGYAEEAPFPIFEVDVRDCDTLNAAEAALTSKGDDLFHSCIRDYARWRGAKRQLQEGLIVSREQETEFGIIEVDVANPVNLELDRMDRTVLKQKDNLLDDSESQIADALAGGLDLTLSSEDKDALETAFDTE